MEIGGVVDFVDAYGKPHLALVTTVFSSGHPGDGTEKSSLNVVYVSDDESEVDQYGRQIKRSTSVVNEQFQSAHGMFWRPIS